MNVICITGKAGSGKDTFASVLQQEAERNGHRVLTTHYADLVKYVCRNFFHWDGVKDEHGRTVLQTVGTNIVRFIEPNYWVDFISFMLDITHDLYDIALIPDCRFPNEVARLKEGGHNVVVARIERPDGYSVLTGEQKQHSSETAMDQYEPDFVIHNDGEISDLVTYANKCIASVTQKTNS